MIRYYQLLQLIDIFKPKTIIEVGVWNGNNAKRMLNKARQYHDNEISFTGFDLFEAGTAELDAKELNVKPHNTLEAVKQHIINKTSIIPNLIAGDTNHTIEFNTTADFTFIDGGHSIETIANDFSKLCKSKVIILDDYYTPDENGNCPDITKYGCNSLVKTLNNAILLPLKDPVKGGGYTQFVMLGGATK